MRPSVVEDTIKDVFALHGYNTASFPVVEFKENNTFSHVVDTLMVGVPDVVDGDNIEEVQAKIISNLNDPNNVEIMNQITDLGTGITVAVSKAMEKLRGDIRSAVDTFRLGVTDKYREKLIRDNHEELLGEGIDPTTHHLESANWSWINPESAVVASKISSVLSDYNVASTVVDRTAISILSSKMQKKLTPIEDVPGLSIILENVQTHGKTDATDVTDILAEYATMMTSSKMFEAKVRQIQQWMTAGLKDRFLNRKNIPLAVKALSDIPLFENMSGVLSEGLDEQSKNAFLNNLQKLHGLYNLLLADIVFIKRNSSHLAVLADGIVNDDNVAEMKDKYNDKYLVQIARYQRMRGNKPGSDEVFLKDLFSATVEQNILNHKKILDGEAKLMKRNAIEAAFQVHALESLDMFASLVNEEVTPQFKDKIKIAVNRHIPHLKGDIDNLQRVSYDMMVELFPNKIVQSVYQKLSVEYDNVVRAAESIIDDVSWKTEEVKVVTDIVAEYLSTMLTSK